MNVIPFLDKYYIHIIDSNNYDKYEKFLENMNICDPYYLSKSFEGLSYGSLESESGIGFFLTDKKNTTLYASAVFDLECYKNKDIIVENGYDLKESIELNLLCANGKTRIPGLTTEFVEFILNNLIKSYAPNAKYVFLYVAKKKGENPKAYQFYSKLGFTPLGDSDAVMMYPFMNKGGRRRTKRHKRKRSKTKKRRRYY
jgi:hypothetical protein